MHDFCFTIPYGFAVLAGGLLGYLRRGSTVSLAGGAGVGGLLLLAGFVSLKAFEKRRNSYLALALETLCALALTFVMGQRYLETSKIMPAGVVAALSSKCRPMCAPMQMHIDQANYAICGDKFCMYCGNQGHLLSGAGDTVS